MKAAALHRRHLQDVVCDISQSHAWRTLLMRAVPSTRFRISDENAPLPKNLGQLVKRLGLRFMVCSRPLDQARSASGFSSLSVNSVVFMFEAEDHPDIWAESFNNPDFL
ncbi:MAG: hypothetical protein HYS27_25450 [Deltaproteobacteria bacterium]|nr:hypothetical protein [Deltaproteobacteria bacterium]